MIDGYLRQGYNFCNLQGNWKWKKKGHSGYIYSSQMLWSNRRASRIHWIELKTKQEGKENTGRIIRFHYMFNKIEKQNLERTLYRLWKRYQEQPADNMNASAHVCLSSA